MARRFRTDRDTATGRLIHAYRDGGDERARTRLVELYMPLVEALAHRHERRGAEHDDLVQAGSIGLLNAIDRFDPKRGEEFVAFAVPTVAGEIKRYLRDRAATVRLPRRLHEAPAHPCDIGERERPGVPEDRRDDAGPGRDGEREVDRVLALCTHTPSIRTVPVGRKKVA
mgnify:CR=1 FL=1